MKQILMLWCAVALFGRADGQIITTIAGGGSGGNGSPAIAAHLNDPTWLTFDKQGNYYIVEGLGYDVRKVDIATGIIDSFAGTGNTGYNGDGGLADTTQLSAGSATFDSSYNYLYIPDPVNNRVRRVSMPTNIITTFAGNGIQGSNGDASAATSAMLYSPNDVCFDKFGNTYICDGFNYKIRKIDATGIISTYAGTGISGWNADSGLATAVELGLPRGITTDDSGNLYIADEGNVDNCIWKVNPTGIITTFAGNHTIYTYNGDNIPATTAAISPVRIVFHSGNFYIADFYNNRIREVDASGIIHTVAGNGIVGFSGDGGSPDSAELNGPSGIAFDSCDNMYITEVNVGRIRKITYPTCHYLAVPNVTSNTNVSIYPNPAYNTITITASTAIKSVAVLNLIGQTVYTQEYNSEKVQVNIANLPVGIYFVKVNEVWVQKVVKE